MDESRWVQFSGPGAPRKRAQIACVLCHSKKVRIDSGNPVHAAANSSQTKCDLRVRITQGHRKCSHCFSTGKDCRYVPSCPCQLITMRVRTDSVGLGLLNGTKDGLQLRLKGRAPLRRIQCAITLLDPRPSSTTMLAVVLIAQAMAEMEDLQMDQTTAFLISVPKPSCRLVGHLSPKEALITVL